jgi:hypothetical protein
MVAFYSVISYSSFWGWNVFPETGKIMSECLIGGTARVIEATSPLAVEMTLHLTRYLTVMKIGPVSQLPFPNKLLLHSR